MFLSRYEDINFRFKGRVTFKSYRENELISYIKNEDISPRHLLLLFDQNENELSKFNVPVLTPTVVANIYSKTSLYQFPETEKNNRVNMLNDPLFVKLEKSTFMNLHKLNDDSFCSAVWSFAVNHEQEQGVLNKKVSDRANLAVFDELTFRMYNMSEENLGLLLRALSKMPLMRLDTPKWGEVVAYIRNKLPQIQNTYTCESVFEFLMCLPLSPELT